MGVLRQATVASGLGEKLDGLLGMDVLSRFVISIDFDTGRLRFHRDADPDFGAPVTIAWYGGNPYVRAAVAGRTIELLVDTGGVETVSGTLEARDYNGLVGTGRIVTLSRGLVGFTAAGSVPMRLGRVGSLSFGGFVHKRVLFGCHASGSFNCLGLGYLSRYSVTIDFPNSVVYLRPGKAFTRADDYDLSCLAVSRTDDSILVAATHVGGAAAAAGIKKGDRVLLIDGHSTRAMSLFRFRRFLHTQGTHVLEIDRNGMRQRIVLALTEESNPNGPSDEAK